MSKIKFTRKWLALPYAVFMVLFVIIPLVLILAYAFTDGDGNFTFANLGTFFGSAANINTILVSFIIGAGTTVICLLLGYPVAYFLAHRELKMPAVMMLLFIMPMWINFVLRTAATRDLLYWIGLNGGEHPYLCTMIGMVYNYLPFVILPLYTTMTKLDYSQIEASSDLGARPWQTFVKIILPMTAPGIVSAATMVFMPTMSSYVISDVMGERKLSLIGNSIQLYFDQGLWHMGSIVAVVMLLLIFVGMFATKNVQKEDDVRGTML